MKINFGLPVFVSILLAACSPVQTAAPLVTPSPGPTVTEAAVLPTPSSPGDSIDWEGLQVRMGQVEVTNAYETDYGSTRFPPAGGKFLWVQIGLINTARVEKAVPASEHYSVLYASIEFKPTYGHRQGYKDYTVLPQVIFPDQRLVGWLRFDIPGTAGLGELLFVFIPESAQVGASYESPNYPYAADKPTFVWDLEP